MTHDSTSIRPILYTARQYSQLVKRPHPMPYHFPCHHHHHHHHHHYCYRFYSDCGQGRRYTIIVVIIIIFIICSLASQYDMRQWRYRLGMPWICAKFFHCLAQVIKLL